MFKRNTHSMTIAGLFIRSEVSYQLMFLNDVFTMTFWHTCSMEYPLVNCVSWTKVSIVCGCSVNAYGDEHPPLCLYRKVLILFAFLTNSSPYILRQGYFVGPGTHYLKTSAWLHSSGDPCLSYGCFQVFLSLIQDWAFPLTSSYVHVKPFPHLAIYPEPH